MSVENVFPTGLLSAVMPPLVARSNFPLVASPWPGTLLPLVPGAGLHPLKWEKTNRPSQWLGRFDIESDLLLRVTG